MTKMGLVSNQIYKVATHIIYVDVQGYPVKIWNPVQSTHMHDNCYRVLESSPDPEHEYWEFEDGDIVCCESHNFAEGETGLIAVAKCECGSTLYPL
jgi:hypothetical protein